jgi:hypothetical protein
MVGEEETFEESEVRPTPRSPLDNTAIGDLIKFLGTAEGQGKYVRWFKSPVTRLFLAAGRELCFPQEPIAGERSSDFQLGKSIGGNVMLDVMVKPLTVCYRALEQKLPEPLYGAQAIRDRGEQ